MLVYFFSLRRKDNSCFLHNSRPLVIAFLKFSFVLRIQVIPLRETAILLLSSKYSRIILKVLWLTCFGSLLFNSAIVTMLPSIFFRVSSTMRTVFKVGECSNLFLYII